MKRLIISLGILLCMVVVIAVLFLKDVFLYDMARYGNLNGTRLIISLGGDVNVEDDFNDATPLHMADNAEIAQLLIDNGANVNAKDDSDDTPLHNAAIWGKIDVMQILIHNGADVNAKNNGGDTPLNAAVDLIMENEMMVAQILIKNGADVNVKDNLGTTFLHKAALFEYAHIVKLLIANGAEANAKDPVGATPLLYAKNIGTAMPLIANGADVNVQTSDYGLTPLHRAAQQGQADMVRLLIVNGAEINARDFLNKTPLTYAIETGNVQVSLILRQYGAWLY